MAGNAPVELIDPDGSTWALRRSRLDRRTVRSLMKRADVHTLIDNASGVEWVDAERRRALAKQVWDGYALPLNASGQDIEYLGHEYTDADQRRLLYLEIWC